MFNSQTMKRPPCMFATYRTLNLTVFKNKYSNKKIYAIYEL